MPVWILKCDSCARQYEVSFLTATQRDEWLRAAQRKCAQCGGSLCSMPSAPNFVIHGYNAKNGYTK